MNTSIDTSIGGGRLLALCAALLTLLTLALAVPSESAAVTERGTSAADTLNGTPQADRLLGLGGNDTLAGREAGDHLLGGGGEDKVRGGLGTDTMRGEAGADVLLARDGAIDRVDCGGGIDVAVVDSADKVAANCEDVERPRRPSEVVTVPGPVVTVEKPAAPPPDPEPEPEPEPGPDPDPGKSPVREELPLAEFPSGHGWIGTPEEDVDDTGPPHVVNNNRSLMMKASGGAETIATSPQLAPVDFSHAHVAFQAKVGLSGNLRSVRLRLASGDIATDYAEATLWQEDEDPIILQSSFELQSLPTGAFDVVGEVDWSTIDRAEIVLSSGLGGEVILYVAGIYAVPTKERAEISFTFDDTYLSTYTLGMKKLSAYRFPATAYVIADIVGDPGRMTLEQLYELRNLHHWEIAGHSMTLAAHNLPSGLNSLEPEPAKLEAEMDALRGWLDENGFKRRTFSYPKGAAGQGVRKYVRRDYCAGRATAEGPETIPTRDDYTMRGWSISSNSDTVDSIKAKIDRAVAEKAWLMLTWHDLVGTPDESADFSVAGFEQVVDYVRSLQLQGKVRVRTVAGALEVNC